METAEKKRRNYKDTSIWMDQNYRANCEYQLSLIFSFVSLISIRRQMDLHNNHFIAAADSLRKLVDTKSDAISFIKTKRTKKQFCQHSAEFDEEFAFYMESQDFEFASQLNVAEYETEGQGIDCCCCSETVPFESLTQCNAGHLFCLNCIKDYVERTVFGEERNDIHCIDFESNCTESFPESSIEKALSAETFKKYLSTMQMIEIKKAAIPGLTNCLHCDYVGCMDPGDTVFNCLGCKKNTCILCEQTAHPNQPCPKKETITQEQQRKAMEEDLTKERLRQCPCGTPFIKTEGCNKIVCSKCNATMCYVCRANKIDYSHFCSCPDRGTAKSIKECLKCKKCILFFTNTEKMDEQDIESLQKKRKAETSASFDFTKDDEIVSNKKARVG